MCGRRGRGGSCIPIEPVARIVPSDQQPSDAAYWRSRPPEERLAALESIRREYHLWKYHGEPRLEKVVTIVKIRRPNPPEQPIAVPGAAPDFPT